MTTIQNVACIDLICDPQDKIIKLTSEILRGKKILSIFVCGVPEENHPIYNPPRPKKFLDSSLIQELGLYLNLFDCNGNNFVKSFSSDNFLIANVDSQFIEFEINRVIDWDKSNFTYKAAPSITVPAQLRVFIFYQTHNFYKFSDEVNGSLSIIINHPNQKLSDYVGKSLNGKRIKKIIATENLGTLNLVCANNKIENLDTFFLKLNSPKEFYFDLIDIDYEKSTYFDQSVLHSDRDYYQQLTFIY